MTRATTHLREAVTKDALVPGPLGAGYSLGVDRAALLYAMVCQDVESVEPFPMPLLGEWTVRVEGQDDDNRLTVIVGDLLRYRLGYKRLDVRRLCLASGCPAPTLGSRYITRVCEGHLDWPLPGGHMPAHNERDSLLNRWDAHTARLDALAEETDVQVRDLEEDRVALAHLKAANPDPRPIPCVEFMRQVDEGLADLGPRRGHDSDPTAPHLVAPVGPEAWVYISRTHHGIVGVQEALDRHASAVNGYVASGVLTVAETVQAVRERAARGRS